MKESFQKQYDEKSTPWNYDGFDKDIQKFLEENKVFSVWNYSELDKDFDEVFKKLNPRSTVIDLGCGNGAQAYHIQKMGFDVTGTDIVNVLEYELDNFIIDDGKVSGSFTTTGSFGRLEIGGNANIGGDITLGGDITIGDSAGDSISFEAEISSSLVACLSSGCSIHLPILLKSSLTESKDPRISSFNFSTSLFFLKRPNILKIFKQLPL